MNCAPISNSRPRSAHTALARSSAATGCLLGQVLKLAGGHGELLRHDERPWASVTFSGTRHTIALAFTGTKAITAAERVIDNLCDHEFDIPGHIVADAQVREVSHQHVPAHQLTMELEILLLEDL